MKLSRMPGGEGGATTQSVFVAVYGSSSGLILPRKENEWVEWAWGDWDYLALQERGVFSAVRAAFFSSASALGRREKTWTIPSQVHVSYHDLIKRMFYPDRLLELKVEARAVHALIAKLDSEYETSLKSGVCNPDQDMFFVQSQKSYSIFYNSNHRVRDWLQALGYETKGWSFRASFELSE